MKKLIALLLAVAMVLGLVACGSTTTAEQTKAPSSSNTGSNAASDVKETETLEPMTISVAFWDAETSMAGDPILEYVCDKFNVEFEVMNITWDDYTEKEQLWAATDSLPDIFAADFRNTGSFVTWARDGVISALPSDLSAYPNLEAYMSGAAGDGCKVDGDYYCIFRQTYGEQADTVKDRIIAYRWDLAQAAGVTEEPTNWDEFRDMLKAIMAADPLGTNIGGLTALGYSYLGFQFLTYSSPLTIVEGATFKWVEQDGQYIPAYFAGEELGSGMLDAWNLLRDMYTEGTIDPDIALTNLEGAKNGFLSGQFAALCTTQNTLWKLDNDWETMADKPMEDCIKFLHLCPSADGNTYSWPNDYAWSETMISGNVDDAKMERILMLYDYLLSDEGMMLTQYGYEGETYEIVDGKVQIKEGVVLNDIYPCHDSLGQLAAWKSGSVLPNGYAVPSGFDSWYDDMLEDYVNEARACTMPESAPACISAFLGLGNDFSLSVMDDMLLIMVDSRPVEEVWQEILDGYIADGLYDVIEQVNAAVK